MTYYVSSGTLNSTNSSTQLNGSDDPTNSVKALKDNSWSVHQVKVKWSKYNFSNGWRDRIYQIV